VVSTPPVAYALALLASAAALGARFLLNPHLPPGFPFLTFFPAVVVCAFFLGTGPGIVCAVVSGLASWYFFIAPDRTFDLNRTRAVALGFYVFIVSVNIALIHWMRVAQAKLHAEQAVTMRLYEQQRTMFQELQHRVANNMAFVSSLLGLQRRHLGAEAAVAIDEARGRIDIMSRVHRLLYDPDRVDIPIGDHLSEIARDTARAAGREDIAIDVDALPVQLELSRLMTVSLLVAELVMNGVKHAFPAGRTGRIRISIASPTHNDLVLTVADNGMGMMEDAPAKPGGGLGGRIVQGFAAQLNGLLTYESGNGLTVSLTFPRQLRAT